MMSRREDIEQVAALAGEGRLPEDFTVIDCHGHMGPWFNFHIFENGPEGMIRTMDRCGIQTVCVSHHLGIGPDFRRGNAEVLSACERYPGRFIPYICHNPRYPPQEAICDLKRVRGLGIRYGLKIHPSVHRYRADGERYRVLWEHAEEHSLPILSHTWEGDEFCSPDMFDGLAERYPHAKVILGHAGGSWEGQLAAAEIAARRRNIYLDPTGSRLHRGMLEIMVKRIGASRILFGSDIPFLDPRYQLGRVLFARISSSQKRKILGLNSARLFGIRIACCAQGDAGEQA